MLQVSCFITHVNYGLNSFPLWDGSQYIKPVLGGKLSPSNNDFGLLVGVIIGTAYSLFYTILVNLVLPALISGVIIDTFSSMRQEEERINADIRGSCFICSIPRYIFCFSSYVLLVSSHQIFRDDFESNGVDYLKHIRLEHNMWKYVWLKEYLLEKDPLLFSGPEHFAFQQMQDKQAFLKLFPMKRSLSLDREQARAKQGSTAALDLPAIFELIQSLDVAQNEFRKSLADMRRVQFTQVDSSEILQSVRYAS